ncbi:MAG: acyl-CoA dehydrogenase family protein, partial [Myxococcota bacterium]
VRDGDHYIVNGQKTWTTQAQWADWIFCLVRTNNESRPQAGISFILIDMKSPGVEVRPIYTIDGMHHLNEVFLTDVKVPVENRVGDENAGWTYAKFLLTNERAGIAAVANSRTELKRLRALSMSQEHFASPPGHDSYFQDKFADLENRLASLAALEARALAEPEGTLEAMMLGSPLKLLGSHIMQDLAELSVELVGPAALPEVGADSVYGSEGTSLMTSHLLGRAHTIYGGTSEVQKNVISKLIASVS